MAKTKKNLLDEIADNGVSTPAAAEAPNGAYTNDAGVSATALSRESEDVANTTVATMARSYDFAGSESAEEVAQKIGASWSAEIRKLYEIGADGESFETVDASRVVRSTDGAHLAWRLGGEEDQKLVQPSEILEFASRLREATDGRWVSAGQLVSRRSRSDEEGVAPNPRIYAQIGVGTPITIAGEDKSQPYVGANYSYKSGVLAVTAGSTLIVCLNTYQMFFGGKNAIKARSFNDKEIAEFVRKHFPAVRTEAEKFAERLSMLSESPIGYDARYNQRDEGATTRQYFRIVSDRELLSQILDADDSKSVVAELLASRKGSDLVYSPSHVATGMLWDFENEPSNQIPGRIGTFHGLQSAVSHYTDHKAGRSEETRVEAALFGSRAETKVQAVQLAEVFASLYR